MNIASTLGQIPVPSSPMSSSSSVCAAVFSSDNDIRSADLDLPSASSTPPESGSRKASSQRTRPDIPKANEYVFDFGMYEGCRISQAPHHYMSSLRGMSHIFDKHEGLREAMESYDWSNLRVGNPHKKRASRYWNP